MKAAEGAPCWCGNRCAVRKVMVGGRHVNLCVTCLQTAMRTLAREYARAIGCVALEVSVFEQNGPQTDLAELPILIVRPNKEA